MKEGDKTMTNELENKAKELNRKAENKPAVKPHDFDGFCKRLYALRDKRNG